MINVICWNARSINTKGALERLQTLKKMHHLSIIAILEPFANGKILLFWFNEVTGRIMETHDQHITIIFHHIDMSEKFMLSFIYAKFMLSFIYANMELPWCTIGDFNVITSIEEKLGEYPTI